MKYLTQFGLIAGITLVGEILNKTLPLPVPSSVWGMVIMFILLCAGVVKLSQVEEAADFLLAIMTVMFVPVGAGLLKNWSGVVNEIVPIFAVIILSTLVCFFVTGKVADTIIQKQEAKDGKQPNRETGGVSNKVSRKEEK